MSETTAERRIEVVPLDELLGNLQANMRLYDRLTSQISLTRDELTLASLEHLLINKKLEELQRQQADLDTIEHPAVAKELGRQFSLRAIQLGERKVAVFNMPNDSNVGSSFRHWREEGQGRLLEVGLQPAKGGYIKLVDRRKITMYQASPLFDRSNDYEPSFEITEE